MQIKAIHVKKSMSEKRAGQLPFPRVSCSLIGLACALYFSAFQAGNFSLFQESNFNITTIRFAKIDFVSYEAKNDLYQIPYDSYPLVPTL